MRLTIPRMAPDFNVTDIYGQPIRLSGLRGRRVLVSFFREAGCPFCNIRCYELTHHYKKWKEDGLVVIVFFRSDEADIHHFIANHPRPFSMVADPDMAHYQTYEIEHSRWGLWRGVFLHGGRMLRGMRVGPIRASKDATLIPADFLIDEHGLIREAHYGRHIGDHIPLPRIELFALEGRNRSRGRAA